ncbi:MAG: AAA family ATPase [Armatimonadetes bacterium]|nr:AAA family ATPase [Armatimonadota bacterium]
MFDAAHEIEILIRAKFSVIYVTTWEETRVEASLTEIATKLNRKLYTWSVTQGMRPALASPRPDAAKLPSELEVLAQIHEAPEQTIFLIKDFHPYLRDSRVVRLLRDLAEKLRGKAQTLVLVSPTLTLPTELEKDVTVLEYPLPGPKEIEKQLDGVLDAVKDNEKIDCSVADADRELIIKSAQGLTEEEIESAFARSIVEKRKIVVETVLEEKKQIVRKSGLLEFYPAEQTFSDVGGHDLLKDWLKRRREAFTERAKDFGIPAPKGVLMLGVQGCGKSLVAKSIASSWSLPLLKLDVGRIFGSLVGQSEENIRKAIRIAESVAPCCLWADELEKGFAGVAGSGAGDSGTTARVFATFITWMQEKTKPVFLIATANDVSKLPPELLRKGRFDEIFFIDLPEKQEREEIFTIHLNKRKRDPKNFNIGALADATKGFSGAEIEQVVVGALYLAFDQKRDLQQEDILQEAKAQVPLSVMMSEEILELRRWASLRARPSATRTGELNPAVAP